MLDWLGVKKPQAACENPFSFSIQLPKEAAVSPVLGTGGREFESRRPDHFLALISTKALKAAFLQH